MHQFSQWSLQWRPQIRVTARSGTRGPFTCRREDVGAFQGDTARCVTTATRQLDQPPGVGDCLADETPQACNKFSATPLAEWRSSFALIHDQLDEDLSGVTPNAFSQTRPASQVELAEINRFSKTGIRLYQKRVMAKRPSTGIAMV